MIELSPGLWTGSDEDATTALSHQSWEVVNSDRPAQWRWSIVHCAKHPWHRDLVPYPPGCKSLPHDHPERLWALRPAQHRLALNMVDVDDPSFFRPAMFHQAAAFASSEMAAGRQVLVHCNQGLSRGPSVALWIASANRLPASGHLSWGDMDLSEATRFLTILSPTYWPRAGIRGFMETHWDA